MYIPQPGDSAVRTVTLIPGDGIGPEVTAATMAVLSHLKAPLAYERFNGLSGSKNGEPRDDVPGDVSKELGPSPPGTP